MKGSHMKTNMTLKALLLVAAGVLVSSTCSAADGSGIGAPISLAPTTMMTLIYINTELGLLETKIVAANEKIIATKKYIGDLNFILESPRKSAEDKEAARTKLLEIEALLATRESARDKLVAKRTALNTQKEMLDPAADA